MTAVPAGIPERVLVTGGAGFIGSHLADALLAAGRQVTVLDNRSNANDAWVAAADGRPGLRLIVGDLNDVDAVAAAVAGQGLVCHLAGNADIPGGVTDRRKDLTDTVTGTCALLDAMAAAGVPELIFTSTGAVYGDDLPMPWSEASGPLAPVSLYGAGKIAAEAFISAYCHLFGLRATVFRLGNVVGGRMSRGAIRDFIGKLRHTTDQLDILGDGTQRKNYFLVEDCVHGMLGVHDRLGGPDRPPYVVLNLGAADSTGITTIARTVGAELGHPDVPLRIVGGGPSWPGDQPRVELDVCRVQDLGFATSVSSDEAIRVATARMVECLDGGRP